ncbi:MAG TPA: mechanosensitive ion channel family protein [Terracidiphilus sp.]|nr:mechanosensitive ion channel family protein [Terracidiphilus sp.]
MFPLRWATEFCIVVRSGIFAEGRFMGKVLDEWVSDSQEFIHTKLPHLVVLFAIAFFLNKLLRIITGRMVRVAEHHAAGRGRIAEVKTLASVIRATGLAIIGVIVGMQFLAALGVNLAPLLASAGVAGVAIGLAAQTIVKDMFNGILILVEGQFNVGDSVKLAGLAGTVEAMTLRKTTIRDGDGTLYVIPNSQITTVANLSADFSVATINVSVDFSANPDKVMALLKQIALDVRNSEQFKNLFVADPQVLGVDSMKGSQLIFPVVFKTLPTQQYGPMREFQRRVRLALEENHMLPGDPLRVYSHSASVEQKSDTSAAAPHLEAEAASQSVQRPPDPTAQKSQETNPFSGE